MTIQDSGQLEAIYGKAAATTVIGNSGCLLAFAPAPADNDTAEFLSKAAGTHWVRMLSASDDPHGGPSRITVNEHEERLWPPDKIRRLPRFHALVFRAGLPPQPVYCAPYFTGELNRFIGGRYDPDPYHPAGAAPEKRQVGKVLAAIATAAIAGGIWLSHAFGQHEHPNVGALSVEAKPPPRVSPPDHRRH